MNRARGKFQVHDSREEGIARAEEQEGVVAGKRDKQTSEDDCRFDLVKRAEIVFVS